MVEVKGVLPQADPHHHEPETAPAAQPGDGRPRPHPGIEPGPALGGAS